METFKKQETIKLWLDDERPMPDDFTHHCKNVYQAIELLKTNQVSEISLDYFLGDGWPTGIEVAKFIENGAKNKTLNFIPHIHVHSHSESGKKELMVCLRNAYQHWKN